MQVNHLVVTVDATHQALQQRLDRAMRTAPRNHPRAGYAWTDAFLSSASRHLAAVEEVVVPAARLRLPDGAGTTRAYLDQARRLEGEIAFLKARAYGQVNATRVPWSEVWDSIRRELVAHNRLERRLVDGLALVLGDAACDELAGRLYRAEVKAPTRAHPHLPHGGAAGLVAHRVWALADRFWDTVEGRIVPPVVRPHPHRHDSLVAQYLLGEPLLDATAPLIGHRHRAEPAESESAGQAPTD